MGGGSYSFSNRVARAESLGYATKSVNEIFEQNEKAEVHELMSPKDIKIRESRDSEEHPNSIPIIIGLDETGSMGHVPHELVRDGLPHIMGRIIEQGIPDPQVLFLGIGDHKSDRYPLQVSQFESSDEKLDYWLTKVYLEGNGGGNGGESYPLAWYLAGYHTSTDSWEKRKVKGFLFTVGDEHYHKTIDTKRLKNLMSHCTIEGNEVSAAKLLAKAQEMYHVYHIHLDRGYTADPWKELLGDNCIVVSDYKDVAKTIADIVTKNAVKAVSSEKTEETKTEETKITL